jgi:hypothetical protein
MRFHRENALIKLAILYLVAGALMAIGHEAPGPAKRHLRKGRRSCANTFVVRAWAAFISAAPGVDVLSSMVIKPSLVGGRVGDVSLMAIRAGCGAD